LSEQQSPPLFVVHRTYDVHRICQRDEHGIYRPAIQMQGPYDHSGAAMKLCEALETIGEPLLQNPDGKE
jgi:hypothetical protein